LIHLKTKNINIVIIGTKTLSNKQLQAFFSTACWIRFGFVTVRSSPTSCMPTLACNLVQFSQSSWSKASSIDCTG
jgi:hypothetical protein